MTKHEEYPIMRNVKPAKGGDPTASAVVIDSEEDGDMQPQGEFLDAATGNTPPTGRVRIIVEENDDIPPTGLYVGLNGRGYLIRAGEPVDVPAGVVEILDNATTMVPQVDQQTRQVIGYRPRMRFAYRHVA